jgi:hypothetical protein
LLYRLFKRFVMPVTARWTIVSFLALITSTVLVLMSAFSENDTLAPFPTYDYGNGNGLTRGVGYGFPFAFREVVTFIDHGASHYHWGYLLFNICLVAAVILLLFRLITRALR